MDLGQECAGSESKRSQGMKIEECSRGMEQEHMVMSRSNRGAEEVGDDS